MQTERESRRESGRERPRDLTGKRERERERQERQREREEEGERKKKQYLSQVSCSSGSAYKEMMLVYLCVCLRVCVNQSILIWNITLS